MCGCVLRSRARLTVKRPAGKGTGGSNQHPAVEFPPQEIHAAGMNAILALEDGTWYRGVAAGATGEAHGEVVFNTSMTGYQEVLTDPSYAGQIVTMTAPQIGNYGVAPRRRRVAGAAGGRLHHARGLAGRQQLARRRHPARLPGPPQHRRDRRHRHPRAHARAALGRRDARRHRHRRRSTPRRSSPRRARFRRWKARTW